MVSSSRVDHNMRNENYPHRKFGPGIEGGGRIGYYPLPFLGIEGEFMTAGASVKNSNNQVALYGYRVFGVLQAPTPYISPFLVAGGGRIGAVSRATGHDGDQGFLFGVGVKVPFNQPSPAHRRSCICCRTCTSAAVKVTTGSAARPFGNDRPHAESSASAATDSDRDGFSDADDRCPNDVGVAPDGCPADTIRTACRSRRLLPA